MLVAEAPDRLAEFAASKEVVLSEQPAPVIVELVADWYDFERVEDLGLIQPDGDMLLFQWGVYDWGDGRAFEYDITRQFYRGTAHPDGSLDPVFWHLSVTARFPDSVVGSVPDRQRAGNRWCSSPSALDDFLGFVRSCSVTAAVASRLPDVIHTHFGSV